MTLNLGGTWYKIEAYSDMPWQGLVHHESGLIILQPSLMADLKRARGDTVAMKKIFTKLTPVEIVEGLTLGEWVKKLEALGPEILPKPSLEKYGFQINTLYLL